MVRHISSTVLTDARNIAPGSGDEQTLVPAELLGEQPVHCQEGAKGVMR